MSAAPRHLRLVWSAGARTTPTRPGPCHITDHERPAGRFCCDCCIYQRFVDGGAHVCCTSPTRYFRPRT